MDNEMASVTSDSSLRKGYSSVSDPIMWVLKVAELWLRGTESQISHVGGKSSSSSSYHNHISLSTAVRQRHVHAAVHILIYKQ